LPSIFTIFWKQSFALKPGMKAPKNELQPSFEPAASPPRQARPARVTVTLDLDADVVEWLRAQPIGLQPELNNLARFYMETTLIREAAFEDAAGSDEEIQIEGLAPARNASKIDHDFIPG
jgi:uncharacterized protein (DUF4415 family)